MKYNLLMENWKKFLIEEQEQIPVPEVNLFVLIGPPAVGKSTWENKYFKGISRDNIIKINRDSAIERRFATTGFSNRHLFSVPPENIKTGETDPKNPELGKVIEYEYGGKKRRAYSEVYYALDKINKDYNKKLREAHTGYYPYVLFDGIYAKPEQRKALVDSFSHIKNLKKIAVFFDYRGNEQTIVQRSIDRAKKKEEEFGTVKGRKFDRSVAPEAYREIFSGIEEPTYKEPAGFDVIMKVSFDGDGEYEVIKEALHIVHHGSVHDFVVFDPEKSREFGFHFGTLESAKHRNSAFVKKYEITIDNPLYLDDVMFWEPSSILDNMVLKGYINEQEKNNLLKEINTEAARTARLKSSSLRYEKNEILKRILKQDMKYDGIIYQNRGETGDTAYITLFPEQAKYIENIDEAKKKRDYKPNFSKEKEQGLHGWFARNKGKGWVNCRTGGPCGRESADSGGKYPACRPTKAQCKSAGKGPLRKKKSSKPISWTKKKKKD